VSERLLVAAAARAQPALLCLAGQAPDDAALGALRAVVGESLPRVSSAPAEGVVLLWVGEAWDAGLEHAVGLDPSVRARTLLVGARAPAPSDRPPMGERVRAAGLLTWWVAPFPPWVWQAARQAVGLAPETDARLQGAIAAMDAGGEGARLLRVAGALLDQARGALDADHALLGFVKHPDEGSPVVMVFSGATAGLRLTTFEQSSPERACLGEELVARARGFGRPLMLPEVQAQRLVPAPVVGAPWRGVLAVPSDPERSGDDGPVLLLYWDAPRILHPQEWRYVDGLQRALEREVRRDRAAIRQARRHDVAVAAMQDELERRTPSAGGPVRPVLAALLEASVGLVAIGARVPAPGGVDGCGPWVSVPARSGLDWSSMAPGEQPDGRVLVEVSLPAPSDDAGGAQLPLVAPRAEGRLRCLWADAERAADGDRLQRGTAQDLALGALVRRQRRDADALGDLSRALADTRLPLEALHTMAARIAEALDADGVRVHVLVAAAGETRVEGLVPGEDTLRFRLEGDIGLTRRALQVEAPLFVRHADLPGADPRDGLAWTPGELGGPEVCRAADEDSIAEGACTQLVLPLYAANPELGDAREVVGTLAVWRRTARPFERHADRASLEAFAPHISAACRRELSFRAWRRQERAVQSLSAHLHPQQPCPKAVQGMLRRTGELSGGAFAVLLRVDGPRLLLQGAWHQDGPEAAEALVRDALPGGRFPATPPDAPALAHELAAALPGWEEAARVELTGGDDAPWGLALALRPRARGDLQARLAADARKTATRGFARAAGHLLRHHVESRATALIERLSGEAGGTGLTMEGLLARCADALAEELSPDGRRAVVAYSLASTHQTPSHVSPEQHGAALAVEVRSTGPTARLLRRAEPGAVRLVDGVSQLDGEEAEELAVMADALGWEAVGGWLCAPLAHDGRSLGAIVVLSADDDPRPLGPDEALIVDRVVRWAAGRGDRLLRSELRGQLARLSREVTTVWGDEMAARLAVGLEAWAERAARPGAHVCLLARSRAREHVFLRVASRGTPRGVAEPLERLSARFDGDELTWPPNETFRLYGPGGLEDRRFAMAGAAVPLGVAGSDSLGGHLVLLDSGPLRPRELRLLRHAARDLSVVVHGEMLRQEWQFQSGVFRHAMRAPMQGLTSTAMSAVRHLRRGTTDTSVHDELRRDAQSHAEAVRLWSETHKYFVMAQSPDRLDPRAEPVSLYGETRSAVERYGAQMETRGLVLKWAWAVPPSSGPRVRLDVRLFDILLTNLLDNACKYSFANRAITVGCDVVASVRKVRLWVEDVGLPIPDGARDAIYKPGVRSAGRDRVRAIAGEGIGLYLCRAIAQAHGGSLEHRCEPDPLSTRKGPPGPSDPYRVRFTFTFPSRS
jgi:hypothetical protein